MITFKYILFKGETSYPLEAVLVRVSETQLQKSENSNQINSDSNLDITETYTGEDHPL